MFGLMLMQMSTSVNKRMHMINELCKMSLCKVMIVCTYLQFNVDKLFPFEFLSIKFLFRNISYFVYTVLSHNKHLMNMLLTKDKYNFGKKLFICSIMNNGTLGLHPIKENTRMREKMNFDENSGSYYFLH